MKISIALKTFTAFGIVSVLGFDHFNRDIVICFLELAFQWNEFAFQ
jgi:hypothetical protein